MELSQDTKIFALTEKYPFLVNALAERNSSFEKLKNPILRQTMGREIMWSCYSVFLKRFYGGGSIYTA